MLFYPGFVFLGTGRRDSSAQIDSISPPNEVTEPSPTNQSRRRSSLAQLSDLVREWSGGGISGKSGRAGKLSRRETFADITKSFPWSRQTTMASLKKRRESSVDSGIRSQNSTKSRRDSAISEFKNDLVKLWTKRESPQPQQPPTVITSTPRRGKLLLLLIQLALQANSPSNHFVGSGESRNSRRGSGESAKSRRDSVVGGQAPTSGERIHRCSHHRRRQSQASVDGGGAITPTKYYRSDQRPSASSTDSAGSCAVRLVKQLPK